MKYTIFMCLFSFLDLTWDFTEQEGTREKQKE